MTTIKTIDGRHTTDGLPCVVSVGPNGTILIDGVDSRCKPLIKREYGYLTAPLPDMPAAVAGWLWANCDRLPKHTRIGFSADEVAAAYAAAKEVVDASEAEKAASLAKYRKRRRLEREYDNLHNEGGDGYNPYRDDDLSGTAFDRRERHDPEGA